MAISRFLIESGADAAARDNRGLTPWDVASRRGHVHVADFLAEVGGCPTVPENDR
jgi:ankyrin repeat protein